MGKIKTLRSTNYKAKFYSIEHSHFNEN